MIEYGIVEEHEIETKSSFLTFYFIKTDMNGGELEIEIGAKEHEAKIIFYVILGSILVGGVATVYLIAMIIKCLCCKEQEREPMDSFQSEAWILSAKERYKTILKDSPEIIYSKSINAFDHEKCVICLMLFVEEQPIRKLKCKHIFHKNCVEEWIKAKINIIPKCPTCNIDLTKERPEGYIEVQEHQAQVHQ